jgi:hypothetical protein
MSTAINTWNRNDSKKLRAAQHPTASVCKWQLAQCKAI